MIDNDLEEIIIYNTLGKIDLLEDRVEIIENYNLNDIDSPTGKYDLNNQSLYNVESISGTTLEINSDLLYLKSNSLYLTDQSSFESDIDFSKVYFNGAGHSDYYRIIDKNYLSNILSSSLKPATIGFVTENGDTMGLTFKAEKVLSGSSNQNISIGIITTINSDEDPNGGSLFFSNKSGIGGVAINHKIADARLHVYSTETIKAIFSGSKTGSTGIQIVNENITGSSVLSFGNSSTLTTISAYIQKYALNTPTFSGEMVIANSNAGFSFYVQGEENTFKMHSNRNANYKNNFGIGINSLLTNENEARLTVRQKNEGDQEFGYGWIAGAFGGGDNSVGNMVVMGSASSCAILAGATTNALDWADLYVNPYSKTSFGLQETTELSAVVSIDKSTTARASLNIRKGQRPNNPHEGDIWIDTGDTMWIRLGGVDKIFDLI